MTRTRDLLYSLYVPKTAGRGSRELSRDYVKPAEESIKLFAPRNGAFSFMKTKAQKQEELKQSEELLKKSESLIFTDFNALTAEQMRKLRRELKVIGAELKVMKKRLLAVLFKEKGIGFDARGVDGSLGTVFSEGGVEQVSGTLFKFLKELGFEKTKILGGYDVKAKNPIDAQTITMIGQLPAREVLLAQLLGMIAAPIRSFLYVLDQKSKQTVETK